MTIYPALPFFFAPFDILGNPYWRAWSLGGEVQLRIPKVPQTGLFNKFENVFPEYIQRLRW
jgi:hypothetical protein